MNKKRIALCLHGQARGLGLITECSPPSIEYQNKNLIQKNDVSVDVFFHTWDYSYCVPDFKQRILDLYSPKSFIFEPPLKNSEPQTYADGTTSPFFVYSNYSHYHSVYFSDVERQEYETANSFSYDW